MRVIHNIEEFPCGKSIMSDPSWDFAEEKELQVHKIHAYPAKFPAFITTKAVEFAKDQYDFTPNRIADIFCGCGTTAFEAKRKGIDFWGCDINPVATLIARVKSYRYKSDELDRYFTKIMNKYNKTSPTNSYAHAPERLRYWYSAKQYNDLMHLKKSITSSTPKTGRYKCFFLCAFSNILKPTSGWLTKSIKPQFDPDKKPANVGKSFKQQFCKMKKAYTEIDGLNMEENFPKIVNDNFLNNTKKIPEIDMIITSPPYVTSYEYADLHQLSSLWLGYTKDYRKLRKGTIGSSTHNADAIKDLENLNTTGKSIIEKMVKKGHHAQAGSIIRYFLDMQKVAYKCFSILAEDSLAVFVIGNTEHRNVFIDNARHLSEALLDAGFSEICIIKRNINQKILTPYRDKSGKFSSNPNDKKIYAEEFIIFGRK